MNQLESNITTSFRHVKEDVEEIKGQIQEIRDMQKELMDTLIDTKGKEKELSERIRGLKSKEKIKYVGRSVAKEFVASKEGGKFHIPECPFAQNIKPHHRITFKSKKAALKAGYNPDSCVD